MLTDLRHPALPRLVRGQLPTRAPDGPLDLVAGLLVARAAPFDAPVQRVLLARLGLGEPDEDERRACWSRVRIAYTALRRLAGQTGPPAGLLEALALCAEAEEPAASRLLRDAGLARAGGLALVDELRLIYQLDWPAIAGFAQLEPALRLTWRGYVKATRQRGVVPLQQEALPQLGALTSWLASQHVVTTAGWLSATHDDMSTTARVVRRQVAVGGSLTATELVVGLNRSSITRQRLSQPSAQVVRAWAHEQVYLAQHADRVSPSVPIDGWLTEADRVLVAAAARGPLTRSAAVEALASEGWTPPSAKVVLTTSPVLRRRSRGVYVLVGSDG